MIKKKIQNYSEVTYFKKNGYTFLKINKNLNKKLNSIKKALKNKEKNLIKLDEKTYYREILKIQKQINKKFSTTEFLKIYKDIFNKIYQEKNFSIQHYFYLRAVKPIKNKNFEPISFHRESFQGPNYFKKLFNIWIPILNCSKENALKFYPKSHKFINNVDFQYKLKKTNISKGSDAHQTGHLYRRRELLFKKKNYQKKLFKNNHIILFYGELIHGNGINLTNKIRFSIDARFILKKDMKKNHIQSATGKKYFI